MITEIILAIFAIVYYLFSIFMFATYMIDKEKVHTAFQILGILVATITISPIAVPIILGIVLGEAIKDNKL